MSGTSTPAGVPLSSLAKAEAMGAGDTIVGLVADPASGVVSPRNLTAGAVASAVASSGLFPALDKSGNLTLGGIPVWGVNQDGHLLCLATVPDTNDGFVPVAGSQVIYTDGGVFKRA
jgi:hypothetical protein